MRFLRQQSTQNRGIFGNKDIRKNIYGLVTIDSTDKMQIPKGTAAQNITASVDGQIRYNTDTDVFENRQAGQWAPVRRFEPANVVQQAMGNGDDVETKFGPLVNGDTYNPIPKAAENIIVLIENVFQLATTNYELEQNPPGKAVGWYVVFGTPVPTGKPVTVLHNFDK